MKNDKNTKKLREKALGAIGEVFSNTGISQNETITELESLKDEIDVMITSIDVNSDKY